MIDGCRPLISPHFNLTVEIAAEGDRARVFVDGDADHLAQSAHGRRQAQDQGDGQPLFLHLPVLWLEKYFSRGDYWKKPEPTQTQTQTEAKAHDAKDVA